jgi:DNA-binding transcriptional ArsR family regulator
MAISRDVAADEVAVAAKLFRGLADPTRLRILLALQESEKRVVDLMTEVGMAQATVSAHVACLGDCGLVTGRPEGRQMFYALALPELRALLAAAEQLLGAVGHDVALCTNYAAPAASP